MFKVKHQRTVDCVVCGYRLHKTEPDAIGSLLLGLYDDGEGAGVGEVVRRPAADRRDRLLPDGPAPASCSPNCGRWRSPRPTIRGGARVGHERDGNRWNPAREQQFVALAPERSIEVRYDHMDGGFLPPPRHVPALAPGPRPGSRSDSARGLQPRIQRLSRVRHERA